MGGGASSHILLLKTNEDIWSIYPFSNWNVNREQSYWEVWRLQWIKISQRPYRSDVFRQTIVSQKPNWARSKYQRAVKMFLRVTKSVSHLRPQQEYDKQSSICPISAVGVRPWQMPKTAKPSDKKQFTIQCAQNVYIYPQCAQKSYI